MKYQAFLLIVSLIAVGGITFAFAEYEFGTNEPVNSSSSTFSIVYDDKEYTTKLSTSSQQINSTKYTSIKIPDWLRKNAKWWSLTKISDKDFESGIEYLFQQEIIQIPGTVRAEHGAYEKNLPGWLRQDAGWWSQRLLSDEEFAKSLKWMVVTGHVKI